ncbi:amidase [Noviherbaspirillum sp. Root189]|uniref:amidase n=1 Tax=Noviherbaspirillum sp. Root189 TaxID=1736487 RepID=UPI00070DFBC6|nr:amidase [Noviherbaspirillum sp. Root189]KRB85176.1 amidase [Noviherbaspirillum sp. Root189]
MSPDQTAVRCFVPYPSPIAPAGAAPAVPLHVDGALAGLSFAVKDIFDVAGYPTGCGNPHMLALSGIKSDSAAAVSALVGARATFVGKTYTDELAFSMNGKNAHFGTPRNGGAPNRIPGGSSSGSASAVSNALADFALGTDTGGSVRAPASHCGLIGARTTHARISLQGVMDLAPDFDTCGWFARDIETFAKVGDVLLGDESNALNDAPQILLAADVLALLNERVRTVFMETLQRLAPTIGKASPVNAVDRSFDTLYWAFRHIQGYQAWQNHGERIQKYDFQLGPGVKERFAWSSTITDQQMQEHWTVRQSYREFFFELLGRNKVIVLPTMPDVAPLLTETEEALEDYRNHAIRMLCLAGLTGCPQISLPLMSLDGAPLGFSMIGPRGSDKSLIRLARKLINECQ